MNGKNGNHTILGVIGDQVTGVSYIRFFQPFRHLEPYGFRLATLGSNLALNRRGDVYEPDRSLLDGVSAVIFPQMVASPTMPDGNRVDLVRPLCLEAARRGIPVVYSVDDYLHGIEESNPGYETIHNSGENLETILDAADAVIVTTPVLRDSLLPTGKPVHLLPNAVDPDDWEARPRAGETVRIGWTGSSSHIEDLRMLVPGLRRAQEKTGCDLVLQGLVEMPLAEQAEQARSLMDRLEPSRRRTARAFLDLVDSLEPLRYNHVPFMETGLFMRLLPALDLDIGLCPLLDTDFNRHKSANKFYEYAVTGTVTLASDVTPYRQEVSARVANEPGDWAAAIEEFARNGELRREHLQRQREFVLAGRNIHHLKTGWRDTLREILGRGKHSARPARKTGTMDASPTRH